jgi:hypothetical protein
MHPPGGPWAKLANDRSSSTRTGARSSSKRAWAENSKRNQSDGTRTEPFSQAMFLKLQYPMAVGCQPTFRPDRAHFGSGLCRSRTSMRRRNASSIRSTVVIEGGLSQVQQIFDSQRSDRRCRLFGAERRDHTPQVNPARLRQAVVDSTGIAAKIDGNIYENAELLNQPPSGVDRASLASVGRTDADSVRCVRPKTRSNLVACELVSCPTRPHTRRAG